MVTRFLLCMREKAARLGSSRALTSGPVAPGSSLAFRETTLSTSQLLAKRWPPRLYGRASGDCHDDNQTTTREEIMKQHRSAKLGYALGVLIAAIGFTTSATAQVVDQTTRQQIENLNAAFVGDWNRQDATGVANIFTPDGVWVVPAPAGRQLYVGTQAIQQHAEDNFKSGETYIQSAVEQVWPFEIGGGTPIDKVVVFGAYHLLGQGQSGPIKIDGHWTAMDVRGVDGAWKYRLVTAIHDPPPATAAQMAVSQELSAINQRRNAAFEKGDADAFAADFADNAVYTSSLEPYRIEGKAAIKDFFA